MTISGSPPPPYYAVIFTSRQKLEVQGYAKMAERMDALAKTMPGYLGIESARDATGFGITVSYWESEAAIVNWKKNAEHLHAQAKGRAEWYEDYTVRVAKVERAYAMKKQGRP